MFWGLLHGVVFLPLFLKRQTEWLWYMNYENDDGTRAGPDLEAFRLTDVAF